MSIRAVQKRLILTDQFSLVSNFSLSCPEMFRQRIDALRQADPRFQQGLDPKSNYGEYECWLDEQAHSGFAVGRDNELINVFSNGSVPGQGNEVVTFAKQLYGGLHLNCFAGPVERFYLRHGFAETRREAHWNGTSMPSVVYMRCDM